MFMLTFVARMPIIRPAEPVITPADRSNSPPIISSATTTAGMPIVEATSVQLEMPSSLRKSEFWVQKKTATTTAASSAPISGRRMMRAVVLMFVSRSSLTGTGGGGAAAVPAPVPADAAGGLAAIECLSITSASSGCVTRLRYRRRARGAPPDPGSLMGRLAGALAGELLHRRRVGLVDEAGAREDRLAAADRVGVALEQLQEHDRQVALQVLLLVDREVDRAALDALDHIGVDVERRQLGVGARALDRRRRRHRDVRVQGHHRVVGLVGLELGLDLGLGRGDVRGALDLQVGHVATEALLDAVAALLEADVVLLVDDAEHLLGAVRLQ